MLLAAGGLRTGVTDVIVRVHRVWGLLGLWLLNSLTPAPAITEEPTMDEKKAQLQALWLTAAKADKPIELPCGNEASAVRMRLDIYNAVKRVRAGKEGSEELREAATNVMLSIKKEDRSVLVLQRKSTAGVMQTVAEILKAHKQAIVDPELAGVEESLARFQAKMDAEVDPLISIKPADGKKTPYY
jgi:hypothetical protein